MLKAQGSEIKITRAMSSACICDRHHVITSSTDCHKASAFKPGWRLFTRFDKCFPSIHRIYQNPSTNPSKSIKTSINKCIKIHQQIHQNLINVLEWWESSFFHGLPSRHSSYSTEQLIKGCQLRGTIGCIGAIFLPSAKGFSGVGSTPLTQQQIP